MDEAAELSAEAAAALVDEAERIVVLTGAGISTDSGIPDFRGPNGRVDQEPRGRAARPTSSTTWPTPRCAGAPGRPRRITRRGRPSPTPATGRWSTSSGGASSTRSSPRTSTGSTRRPAPTRPGRRGPRHHPRGRVPGVRRPGADGAGPRPGAGRRGRPAVPRAAAASSSRPPSRSARAWSPSDLERADRGRPDAATSCWPSGTTLAVYPVADVVPARRPAPAPGRDRQRRADGDGRPGRRRAPRLDQRRPAGPGR